MQFVTRRCVVRPGFAVRLVPSLVGLSAVIGQIVLLRELIIVFNGNEISLGIMLATWLLWTATGSWLASRWVRGAGKATRAVVTLECLLGVSLLPTIWALRASRMVFQTVPGELIGPVPMLLTSLTCLSIFCVLSGALFVVAVRLYEQEGAVSASVAMSSAYLLEAAGAGVGGIVASVVLLHFLGSFEIAVIIALLNLDMAAILVFRLGYRQILTVTLASAALLIPLLAYVAPSLNRSSQQLLWRGFHLLTTRDSIYGSLAVIETGNIRSIYDNGVIVGSAPDENAAEEAVHYALLEHAAPRRVLLIGGGLNGSIAQALKHPTVERLDYVELDPALVQVAKGFFPIALASVADARLRVHLLDGRYYLKTAGETFDVIIMNLPEPQTAQFNRFYTAEFFRSTRDRLASGGVLAMQLRASEDYISPELAEFLRCIHNTLRQVFPYVVIIPGETMHFFAAAQPSVLTDDPQVLISRLRNRNLQTRYVREYFIPFRMTADRMEQIHDLLQPLPATPVNRDFAPIAYYFDVVLWSSQFKLGYSRMFQAAAQVKFTPIVESVLAILLLVSLVLAYRPNHERRARTAVAWCVGTTGFTLMALQIFLLLAFQSVYGYLYQQLAILIAMFMSGIAVGSWLGRRDVRPDNDSLLRTVAKVQFLLAISGPVLMVLVDLLSQTANTTARLLTTQLVFPTLALASGMLGGYQFPIATKAYLQVDRDRRGPGALYAIDLLGGCVGALLLSSYFIPVFGFWKTAWFSEAVNLAPVLLAARVSREATTVPV